MRLCICGHQEAVHGTNDCADCVPTLADHEFATWGEHHRWLTDYLSDIGLLYDEITLRISKPFTHIRHVIDEVGEKRDRAIADQLDELLDGFHDVEDCPCEVHEMTVLVRGKYPEKIG